MRRIARSWHVQQQQHKRCYTCPTWWQVEVYNALIMMYLDILEKKSKTPKKRKRRRRD